MSLARGFTLPETLITMAISSVLMISTIKLLPSLQMAVLRRTQHILLREDLWQVALNIGKHIQRAGYCAGVCVGDGLAISHNGQCIIVRWDANNNGKWDEPTSAEPEQTGFRLKDNAIETLRGATSCAGSGWEKITEPALMVITHFQVSERRSQGYAPRFIIQAEAFPVRYSGKAFTVTHLVTGYNLP